MISQETIIHPIPPMVNGETTFDRMPSLLTVDEAAAVLRVNRKTLYEAVRLNEVPGTVRIGKAIRIGRDAIRKWVRSKDGK